MILIQRGKEPDSLLKYRKSFPEACYEELPAEPMIGLFAISLMVAIFVSFFLSLFIYQKVLKWFMAKFNKEDK